jgi:phospholipid/cholesterol/gamma-HCH transport system substrate-binding protein
MVSNISDSEGTAGKLINDPTLYDNFNQTVSEVMKLMYDFRQDPGRFLTINFRLF